jgi:hypothetical protein
MNPIVPDQNANSTNRATKVESSIKNFFTTSGGKSETGSSKPKSTPKPTQQEIELQQYQQMQYQQMQYQQMQYQQMQYQQQLQFLEINHSMIHMQQQNLSSDSLMFKQQQQQQQRHSLGSLTVEMLENPTLFTRGVANTDSVSRSF